jgi:hypothetical protein
VLRWQQSSFLVGSCGIIGAHMSLLAEIQDAAVDTSTPLAVLLRKTGMLRIALVAGMFCAPVPALAQQFVGGAFVVSWQPEGAIASGDPSIPRNGIGGTGVGLGLMAGVFFTPRTAFEVELTIPSRFDGLQIADKLEEQNAHRDLIFSGLFRFRSSQHRPEFVGGFSYVYEDTLQQSALKDFVTGGFFPFERSPRSLIRDTWGLTGGLDFPIPLNSRITIAPQLRVHWISRADGSDPNVAHGLSPVVWRPSLALIARF